VVQDRTGNNGPGYSDLLDRKRRKKFHDCVLPCPGQAGGLAEKTFLVSLKFKGTLPQDGDEKLIVVQGRKHVVFIAKGVLYNFLLGGWGHMLVSAYLSEFLQKTGFWDVLKTTCCLSF
jgi:hypothetical protein